jgi:hypothetical protein
MMARIQKITKAYVRLYTDTGQCKAYVEWIDDKGQAGRTEGESDTAWGPKSTHMVALFNAAKRDGIIPTWERW